MEQHTKVDLQNFTDDRFRWLDKLTRLMDSKFRIPGTSIRFGIDPILNLIPVAGDMITYGISALLVYNMYQYGASRKVAFKMIGNVLLDTIIGAIPVVGLIFDVYYKANIRNINLLKEHHIAGKHQGSGLGIIMVILFVFFLFITMIAVAGWLLIAGLVGLF